MKKIVLALASIAIVMSLPGINAAAKDKVPARYIATQGVGPAIAGSADQSALPKKAEKFIAKIGESVSSVEREFATGQYDVKMTSGMEIDFNKHGKVIEVDAPDNAVIGSDLVKEVVPHKLYSNLEHKKLLNNVTSIEENVDGSYKLEFIGAIDEGLFSASGEVIALYYD